MTTAVSDHLRRIYDEHQELTPALVVAEATPKGSPLHAQFEWDNKIAGDKYRLVQARELIRSCIIERGPDDENKVRAYVSVTRVDGPSYVPTEVAGKDDWMRTLVLKRAEREWKTLQRKYSHLAEFMDLVRGDVAS